MGLRLTAQVYAEDLVRPGHFVYGLELQIQLGGEWMATGLGVNLCSDLRMYHYGNTMEHQRMSMVVLGF